jgi:hypothetical protein
MSSVYLTAQSPRSASGRCRPVAPTAEFSSGQTAMLARPAGFGQEPPFDKIAVFQFWAPVAHFKDWIDQSDGHKVEEPRGAKL